jgi:hypothetical protein
MALLTLRRPGPGVVPVAPNYPGSIAPAQMQALPYGQFVGPDGQVHDQFDLASTEVSMEGQNLTWAAGAKPAPVPVIHANYLADYELHVQLSGTIDQVASESQAPAVAANGLGALFEEVRLVYSGQDNPVQVAGRWLPVRQQVEVHAFADTAKVSLPAQNTTTAAVTGNWSIDAILRVPVALSLRSKPGDWSPRGLVMVQDDAVSVYLYLICGQLTDFLSVDSSDTINLTSGTIQVRQNALTIPEDPYSAPDLSELHTMQTITHNLLAGTRTQVPILTGDVYTRFGFAVVLASGQVDATNSAGLKGVTIQYSGGYRKDDTLSPEEIRYRQATRDGVAVPAGFYVFDWADRWPRQVVNAADITDFRLVLNFSAAPASGTLVETFQENLVPAA